MLVLAQWHTYNLISGWSGAESVCRSSPIFEMSNGLAAATGVMARSECEAETLFDFP
jgi:hypothetical protein